MTRIIWTDEAEGDVANMLEWLHDRNPAASRRARTEVRKAVSELARRPMIGRPASKSDRRIWSLPIWKRRIVYEVGDGFVRILTVKHTSQNIDP